MIGRSLVLMLILATAVAHGELRFTALFNGKVVGIRTVHVQVDKSGRLHYSSHFVVDLPNVSEETFLDDLVDKNGRPIRTSITEINDGHKKVIQELVDSKELRVTVTEYGKSTVRIIPIPRGNFLAAFTWWFAPKPPRVGEVDAHLHFNLYKLKWEAKSYTYIGDGPVDGTNRRGHHILSDDGQRWVDDEGQLIRSDTKGKTGILSFVRR